MDGVPVPLPPPRWGFDPTGWPRRRRGRGRGRPRAGDAAGGLPRPGCSRCRSTTSRRWCGGRRCAAGVLRPERLRVSRSLRQAVRRYETRVDTAFDDGAAGVRRPARPGAWISEDVRRAYERLHAPRLGALGGDVRPRRPAGGRALRRGDRRPVRGGVDVPPRPRRLEGRAGALVELLAERSRRGGRGWSTCSGRPRTWPASASRRSTARRYLAMLPELVDQPLPRRSTASRPSSGPDRLRPVNAPRALCTVNGAVTGVRQTGPVPELPEVEALVHDLRTRLDGRAVARVDVAAFSVLKTFDPPRDRAVRAAGRGRAPARQVPRPRPRAACTW